MRLRLTLIALLVLPPIRAAEPRLDFNRDIRTILSDNCFACHGFDAKKRKADLRLDVPEGAFQVSKEGTAAVRPRDLNGSELWKRIVTTDADDLMPPPDSHKKLTAAHYVQIKFSGPAATPALLREKLRLNDSVYRTFIQSA